MPDLELRTARAEDRHQLAALISGAFLNDPNDEVVELARLIDEPDRTHLISDDGRPVATGAALTREMSVPGAAVATAHVTGVAVASTHRRRGLLTRVMRAQLDDIRGRGEPIAALWASEGAIYGRFGYGLAAHHAEFTIATQSVQVPGVAAPGHLTQVRPADAHVELAEIYERVWRDRPGWSSRPGEWWKFLLSDAEKWRDGHSTLRGVIHRSDAGLDGFALWRSKLGWNDAGPDGNVRVVEVAAASPQAYAALWRFLLSIDLSRKVTYTFGAVDEPLPHIVPDAGAIVTTVGPSLWVRVADVPAALSARRYAAPIDLVISVTDDLLPANSGRWRLTGDTTFARCEATDAEPDLALAIADLGAVYLGGTTMYTLAAAGRVDEHADGALAAASTAFGWHCAPSAVEIF